MKTERPSYRRTERPSTTAIAQSDFTTGQREWNTPQRDDKDEPPPSWT